MRVRILASAFVAVCLLTGPAVAQQTAKPIDYDTFCKLPDVEAKRSAFFEATPATRADLVRTQVERWRDANRARLTEVQLKALTDLIASITPEVYSDGPTAEEQRVKARRVSEQQFQHFTREEVQAMQPNSPCIAKAK